MRQYFWGENTRLKVVFVTAGLGRLGHRKCPGCGTCHSEPHASGNNHSLALQLSYACYEWLVDIGLTPFCLARKKLKAVTAGTVIATTDLEGVEGNPCSSLSQILL